MPDGEVRVKPSYVVRRYGPKDLKADTCAIECTFLDATGRAFVDGLRLEEL